MIKKRSNGETYGQITVAETEVTSDGDTTKTVITTSEKFNSEDQSMSYEYGYKMNGMSFGDYEVKQKGDIINVYSEDEWFLVNDEVGDPNNLLNIAIKREVVVTFLWILTLHVMMANTTFQWIG